MQSRNFADRACVSCNSRKSLPDGLGIVPPSWPRRPAMRQLTMPAPPLCSSFERKFVQFRFSRASSTWRQPRLSGSLAGSQAPGRAAKFRSLDMTTATFAPSAPPVAIPVGEVLPWAIFAGLVLMIAIYFVGAEEGATSLIRGMYVHEFLHDGRHLLGFPCH